MDTPILINEQIPNLFHQLLTYHPRACSAPKENFLTESFAYVMAKDPLVAQTLLQAFVEDRFVVKALKSIRTQMSLKDLVGGGYPDMMFEIECARCGPAQVYVENKWDSDADRVQLHNYLRMLKEYDPTKPKHMVLLTPRPSDAAVCAIPESSDIGMSHMSWSKIHEVVTSMTHAHAITQEFEQFLNTRSLSVRSIRLSQLPALIARQHPREFTITEDASFHSNLWLMMERVIDALPRNGTITKDKNNMTNKYGRCGPWMFDARITFGVLYNTGDHRTAFLNEAQPLDLIVRIEGAYKQSEAKLLRPKFAPIAQSLEAIGFRCDQGNWRANQHTLLLGHHPFPFDLPGSEQIVRVTQIFLGVLAILDKKDSMSLLNQVRPYPD